MEDDPQSVNPEVLEALRTWRRQESRNQEIPAYWILSNRMLAELALHVPTTLAELQAMPGIGKSRIEKYGAGMLETIREAAAATLVKHAAEPVKAETIDGLLCLRRVAAILSVVQSGARQLHFCPMNQVAERLDQIERHAANALAIVERLADAEEARQS